MNMNLKPKRGPYGTHEDRQKTKQNTVTGEELYAHGMRNRNGNIRECNYLRNQYTIGIHHS